MILASWKDQLELLSTHHYVIRKQPSKGEKTLKENKEEILTHYRISYETSEKLETKEKLIELITVKYTRHRSVKNASTKQCRKGNQKRTQAVHLRSNGGNCSEEDFYCIHKNKLGFQQARILNENTYFLTVRTFILSAMLELSNYGRWESVSKRQYEFSFYFPLIKLNQILDRIALAHGPITFSSHSLLAQFIDFLIHFPSLPIM